MIRWRNRAGEEGGAILPLVALALATLLAATSLTIDIGRVANRRRDLQAVADMVAMDAATRLQGASLAELRSSSLLAAIASTAEKNAFPVAGAPTSGTIDGAGAFVPGGTPVNAWRLVELDGPAWLLAVLGERDASGDFQAAASDAAAPTAVRIVAGDDIDYSLAPFPLDDARTDRRAVAESSFTAGVGVRTSVVSLDTADGVVLDALLGSFLGISVGVVDYRGLLGADVSLSELAVALEAASLDDLLTAEVSVRDLLLAEAAVLAERGDTTRAQLLETIGLAVPLSVPPIRLGDLVAVQAGGGVAAAAASLDVLELLTATAMLIDGNHVLSLTGTQLGVPGVGVVPIEVTVVEPPQYAFGPVGVTARTAQLRVELAPDIAITTGPLAGDKCQLHSSGLISGLLECVLFGLLRVINVGNLVEASITGNVPLVLEVAGGEARLAAVQCRPAVADRTATVDPLIGGVDLDVDADLTAAVSLLGTPAVSLGVAVGASTSLLARDPAPLTFTAAQMGTFRSVGDATMVPLGTTAVNVTGDVDVLGLVTTEGSLPVVIGDAVLAPINALVAKLLDVLDRALGLGVLGADVTALAPACATSALVG